MPELLEAAEKGDERPLYDKLTRGSWLPGKEANQELALAFAEACAARGRSVDRLVRTLALLDADAAPGGTELEFLPMCGVAGVAARAASDPQRAPELMGVLHDAAEDLRWRVRAAVPQALAGIGARRGGALIDELDTWLEGYFHAAAVLTALGDVRWLHAIDEADVERVVSVLERAFDLARGANRSASRYPGYKALVEVLATVPGAVALRFGAPIFDVLLGWAAEKKDVALRELTAKNLEAPKLKARFGEHVAAVRQALDASAPPRRDPRSYVGKTRGRGKRAR